MVASIYASQQYGVGVLFSQVQDSAGNSFNTGQQVLDSDGNSFTVSAVVLDSAGNSFGV